MSYAGSIGQCARILHVGVCVQDEVQGLHACRHALDIESMHMHQASLGLCSRAQSTSQIVTYCIKAREKTSAEKARNGSMSCSQDEISTFYEEMNTGDLYPGTQASVQWGG